MSKGTMHRVTILGRLGSDPETKDTKNSPIVKLSVATTDRVKRKDNKEWEEMTTWHRITVFGQSAEFCKSYLKKGDSIYVEAKLRPSKWEDKEGKEQHSLDIVAVEVQQVGKIDRMDHSPTVKSSVETSQILKDIQ
jgi:single-strand DNA-binding protein